MDTRYGQLTYCSNIHSGETWEEHFKQLQDHIPVIKKKICPDRLFGIGLRLSHIASVEINQQNNLAVFQQWLNENDCYVFTMNGFPYGSFHQSVVKDKVHAPDWTSRERTDYTLRLAGILSTLLPAGMDGGISTSPLTYRHWHAPENLEEVFKSATNEILEVVIELITIKKRTGKSIHIDIEPEPDGLLESGIEFIDWYEKRLMPAGIMFLKERLGLTSEEAVQAITDHVQLCYDICHFAVGYEDHEKITGLLKQKGIRTGKIQISAALKSSLPPAGQERDRVIKEFQQFNETTYLHQVIALQKSGALKKYPDLPEAIMQANDPLAKEWRSHFHVPLFVENYGVLQSTQKDIVTVLSLQMNDPFTKHLEIETYTWEVLPDELKLPMTDSIIRELEWVNALLSSKK